MYLFFLDSSGDTQIPHPGASNYYILGGLAIPDYSWPDTATHLKTVKDYYHVNHFPEIKWRHIHQPYEPKGIPDNKQPLINMKMERRYELVQGILEIVKKRPQLIVFATVIDKKAIFLREAKRILKSISLEIVNKIIAELVKIKISAKGNSLKKKNITQWILKQGFDEFNKTDAETLSTYIVEKFDNHIFEIAFSDVINNLEKFLLNAPALHSRLGLVIQDEQDSERNNRYARACFQQKIEKDLRPFNERPLLECLSLVPSHHSVGVQIVDFCMGALNSQVVWNDTKWIKIIYENINKTRRGSKNLGLHTLPK
jgi:hypothetical protein